MRIEKLRFVGITPGIVDLKHIEKLGSAWGLFSFLVMKQTPKPLGYVNYGHAVTIDWIRERLPATGDKSLSPRTLKYWIAKLRAEGYIETQRKSNGLRIRICNAKKWSSQLQIPFDKPVPVELRKTGTSDGQGLAHQIGKELPITRDPILIEVKDTFKEKEHPLALRAELKPQEARVEPFEVFFTSYPRQIQRQAALASWRMLQLDDHLGELLASIATWKNSGSWDELRFVPYPKNFLEKKLWQESPPPRPVRKENHYESFTERNQRESQTAISEVRRRAQQVLRELEPGLAESPSELRTNRLLR